MGAFNARRKAANFTDEAFADACRAAHLAGTRVYVTVNIVIKQTEMAEALALVERCWHLGADAFIIQDWGLFFEIRQRMSEIETHISTQANIHDARATVWCRDAGADRVTLSRELPIDEISHIARTGVELEVFAHGAICFATRAFACYRASRAKGARPTAACAPSRAACPTSWWTNAGAAMRGPGANERCARATPARSTCCRSCSMPSHALKLEGRMKAPDYVYSVVRAYRAQLDDILTDRGTTPAEAEARYRLLKRSFNRDFTTAYQLGTSGDEMMSYERSNNRGQIVGEVLGSRPLGGTRGLKPDDKRRRAAWCTLHVDEPVGKGDLLELRHDDEFDQFLTTRAPRISSAAKPWNAARRAPCRRALACA